MANFDLDYEGSEVQDILDTGKSLEDDGYIFLGTATPSTIPGTPTERVAYVGGPGTYNNFGTTVVVPSGSIVAITYSGSTWSKTVINASLPVSTTLGSDNTTIPTSKAVKDVTDAINNKLGEGYLYAGIATASTNPGTPTVKVFYLARQAGTYTNFGGLTLTEGVNILKYNGTAWSQEQLISIADIFKNPLMGYYECDTAGATAAKTVAATGYVMPTTGGSVKIKMANRNTVANATLNINSTGAKPLFYNGVRAGVGNTWDTNEVIEVFYDGTNYQAYNVAGSNGDGVFDISAYNLTDGQPTPYVDLTAALGTDGEHVPQSLRKGGMSVKFIQGSVPSSDNNYVQFRLMSQSFTADTTKWQGVDDEPTAGSNNLVKSGGVASKFDEEENNICTLSIGSSVPYVKMVQGTVSNKDNTTTITFERIISIDDNINKLYLITNRPNRANCEYRMGYATYSVRKGVVLQNVSNIINRVSVTANGVFINPKTNNEIGVALCLLEYNTSSDTYEELLLSSFNGYEVVVRSITEQENSIENLQQVTSNLGQQVIQLVNERIGESIAIRQGTVSNITNDTCVTSTNIISMVDKKKVVVSTNRPIETGYEYQWGFATYSESSGLPSGATIRRISAQNDNSFVLSAKEKGCAIMIVKHDIANDTYAQLLVSDFEGYEVLVGFEDMVGEKVIPAVDKSAKKIELFEKLYSKKIAIIGDSISTFQGWDIYDSYYPTQYSPADVNRVCDTWWHRFMQVTGSTLLSNASFGGACVTNQRPVNPKDTFYDRVSYIGLNGTPDIILVELGTNDWAYEAALGNEYNYDLAIEEYDESKFIPAYIKGIKALLSAYPNAKIILVALKMSSPYSTAIANIAEHFGLLYVKLRNYPVCHDEVYIFGEEVHPTNDGMEIIANTILQACGYLYATKDYVDFKDAISDNSLINDGLFEVYAPNKEREISELSFIRVYKLLHFQNKYLIGIEAFNVGRQRIFKAYRRYSSQTDATEAMSSRFLFDEESGNAILIDFSKFTGDDFISTGYRDYECTVLLEKYNIISSILFPEHGCEFIDNFENGISKQILGDAPIFGGYDGYIKDPSVFIVNGVYHMYASYAYTRTNNYDTAWYKSVDGIHWEFQKLVFVRGFSQSTTCIAATSKPILCNGVWHIWLTLNVSGYGWCIGHAQCEDIENPEWVADQNVPLLYNDNHHLLDPFILEDNGTYYLFFTYTDTEGQSSTAEQIAYVTSSDCLNWSAKVDVTAINSSNRVCGEGPMVIKAPNGKWRIFTASMDQSLTTEHLDSWESNNLIGPYTKTGIVKMPLSSWGNVCYGHGDVLEIPAGTNNNPKTEYVLYFQETWNGYNYTTDTRKVNVAVGIAKSTDLYHFEAFNYQYYNWADFWKYEDGFIHPESMTCGWKPFIRTYDFYNAFECHSYIKGTGGAIGLVFFAQREQYIHCLEVLLDITNQKVIAIVNANDGASTQVLLESETVLTSNIVYKLEVCKFQHHYIVKLDGAEVGRFYLEDFEELAPGFICNSEIGYFKNLNIKGDLNN